MKNDGQDLDEAITLSFTDRRTSSSPEVSFTHSPTGSQIDPIETIQVTQEAPWDTAGEDLLRIWLVASKRSASSHRKTGYHLKKLYRFFGILSIVSAAIVFFFSNIIASKDIETDKIVHVFVAFINLIIANLTNFLNYGPKYQLQFEFEGKFTKLAVDIEEILAIDADFRSPKDRTLAEYKEKIGNLFVNAPEP